MLRSSRHRVVIIGASFAGLATAKGLGSRFDVTIIDRRTSFEFTPNIHELISGFKTPSDLRLALAPLIHRWGHQYRRGEVVAIDTSRRQVSLANGDRLDYDTLVVAVGGVDNTFGVAGVEEYAYPFKNVEQCAAIGERLTQLLTSSSAQRERHIVIAGGGLEGVEALGEILRKYRSNEKLRVHLVEARDRLLPEEGPALHREIAGHCQTLSEKVSLSFGAPIARITEDAVLLQNDQLIPSELTVWTGGVSPPPLLHEAGLAESSRWADVSPSLESRYVEGVFVIGDAADLGPRVTKQAYHGLDMGAQCAENIERRRRRRALLPYRPSRKPTLIAFGDLDTFLVSPQLVLGGAALAPLKEGVFQLVASQLAPPVDPASIFDLAARLRRGAQSFLAPSSLIPLLRKPGVRVLAS